jgi:ATP-binding cassette subfamily B protein
MEEENNSVRLRFFGIDRMLPFLSVYKKELFFMVLLAMAGTATDVFVPVLQRYALNHFVARKTLDTLPLFLAVYMFAVVFAGIMNYISCKLATEIEVWLDRDMRNKAFEHLQTLSFSYYNQNSVGYIHARVMSDTSRLGTIFSWSLIESVWHGAYLVGSVVVMMAINIRLALLVMMILPLVTLLFAYFQNKMIAVNRQVREINSRITGNFNEGITGARTIKSLVIEKKMEDDFRKDTSAIRRKSVEASRLRGMFAAATAFSSSLAIAVLLWRGGGIAKSDIGTFSMFMTYAQGMMEPVRWLVDVISDLITGQVNIERYTKLLSAQSDVRDTEEVVSRYGDSFSPRRENWEPIRGDIELRDVSFRYPDGDETVLDHFSLKIPFGTNLAVVGQTGAGKSSLANLICRFYEPTSGSVLIDGKDARERSQLWLHSAIGCVLQTPHLFSGTVRDNLLYGNPEATDEQILQALRLVSAESVVNRLEKGLDTDVGEGGDLLSTGEKQLISFARAILADPKILILDEATASVDTITELKIQSAIETVIRNRTSVVIAHRLSTVRNADLILVVHDGKICEQGTHEELMSHRGVYYKLYQRQYEDEATGAVLNG